MGWWDSIFGPSTGYQAMPDAASVTDARVNHNIFPSGTRPHDQLHRRDPSPFGQYYTQEQYDWLNKHGLQSDQLRSVTPLHDPDLAYDPSIVANIKAADARANEQGLRDILAMQQSEPNPTSLPSRPNQIMGTTLNSNPWGY